MDKDFIRLILAVFKRKLVKKFKKRTPSQRLQSRLYYKKNRAKIRFQRRRYTRRTNLFRKSRKMFKRTKPAWMTKKKHIQPKTKIKRPTHKKNPALKPPKIKRPKLHVPKRK